MDIDQLRNEVFAKTKIRLDETDPVFAIVALNEAVLDEWLQKANHALEENQLLLDEKLNALIEVHDQFLSQSRLWAEQARHSHKEFVLTTAVKAKAEVAEAAYKAIRAELRSVPRLSPLDATAREEKQAHRWMSAIVQGIVSGFIAAVLFVLTIRIWM